MSFAETQILHRNSLPSLAYRVQEGAGPTVLWLCGFHSDMSGTKVVHLSEWAARTGQAFVAFDYSGHGQSEGAFADGTITAWRDDALAILDSSIEGDIVLCGSSMGGWMALLSALARPEQVKGILLIAPAPDFTERLMWQGFTPAIRAEIMDTGQWVRPSAYGDEPYPITKALIESGRKHLLLDQPIALQCPIRILHGQQDPDVPWTLSLELAEGLTSPDVEITLIKNGDHRLSTAHNLATLEQTLTQLLASV